MGTALVLTAWLIVQALSASAPAKIRGLERAVTAGDEPFNALGATLFWAGWGYLHDRPRLEQALGALRGFDYIRVLGEVGPGGGWEDRAVSPNDPGFDDMIAGLTDLAFDRYGLRVQWTIFGGTGVSATPAARQAVVARFAEMARARAAKIFAFEIANEGAQNGFGGSSGVAELRALGSFLGARTEVLVSLTSPSSHDACALYAGAGADAMTIHYDRALKVDNPWSSVTRPLEHPGAFDAACRGQLPRLTFNNEPIGPQSSVNEDHDPLRIVLGYVTTFLSSNSAYVLHAGPGIRGGGIGDRSRNRSSTFAALPGFGEIGNGLRAARGYLPVGLANWTRFDANGSPLDGFVGAKAAGDVYGHYGAMRDRMFVGVIAGLRRAVTVKAAYAMDVEVIDPITGKTLDQRQLERGGALTLTPRPRDQWGDGYILKGIRTN